jgi:hypothetical protein
MSLNRIRSRLENGRPLVFDDRYLIERLDKVTDEHLSRDMAFDELQGLLQEHDALLGEEWGGFSNLLHVTLTPDQRVFRPIANGYFDAEERACIEGNVNFLVALREIATPFGVDDVFAGFCSLLETLYVLARLSQNERAYCHFVRWVESLDVRQRLFKLWHHHRELRALNSGVSIGLFSEHSSLVDAALYALSKKVIGFSQLFASQRIVLDELLRAAGLGSLRMYEQAGLIASVGPAIPFALESPNNKN